MPLHPRSPLQKNMAKRAAFLNGSQPLTVHRGQMWLGLFVPGFPCPKLERIGSYGDGGKVRLPH